MRKKSSPPLFRSFSEAREKSIFCIVSIISCQYVSVNLSSLKRALFSLITSLQTHPIDQLEEGKYALYEMMIFHHVYCHIFHSCASGMRTLIFYNPFEEPKCTISSFCPVYFCSTCCIISRPKPQERSEFVSKIQNMFRFRVRAPIEKIYVNHLD